MGDCIHCNAPDCGIPPMYDKPMCMDCWVKHTPEGEAWLVEYEGTANREIEEDYYRRQPHESPDQYLSE